MTVTRGCGHRVAGGIYVEVATSPFGMPLNSFLIDPPYPIPSGLRITPVGVTLMPDPKEFRACLVETAGDQGAALAAVETWHILDWVGAEHYPNVLDVWEEGRRFGFSRRLPKTLEFAKLTVRSRLVLAHGRATIGNVADYRAVIAEELPAVVGGHDIPTPSCPKRITDHEERWAYPGFRVSDDGQSAYNRRMCCGLWWDDLDPDTCEIVLDPSASPRLATREMPSFTYEAHRRPDDVTPSYTPGLFASLPLGRLVVIRDPKAATHDAAKAAASRSGLAVDLEDD